ncbi:hypothetical protein C4565_09830 [Candidatus Parcubacteria bacterium]|nr:MAG: hypothetical protein C4565_09830 [Candidatus Parcubacteria bacterium]
MGFKVATSFVVFASVLVLLSLGSFASYAEAQTFEMYVQKMPPHWEKQFGDVLTNATQYWEEKIPGLKFGTVKFVDQADFVVEWASQYGEGKLGYYSTNTLNEYGKPKLTISLGFFKDKKWNLVSTDYALEITKHELGHAIGLPHSDDPNDMMYPTIESYESWQQSYGEKPKPTPKTSEQNLQASTLKSTIDWQNKSQKYQKLASDKIFNLETKIDTAKSLLDSANYENMAAKVEIEKAWTAFWWAKKYYANAEKMQTDGGAFLLQSEYHDSYKKFKSSYDYAKKLEKKLADISKYHKKAYELEYGKHNAIEP